MLKLTPISDNKDWRFLLVPITHTADEYGNTYTIWYNDTLMCQYNDNSLPDEIKISLAVIRSWGLPVPYGDPPSDIGVYMKSCLGPRDYEDESKINIGWQASPSCYCLRLSRDFVSKHIELESVYSTGVESDS